MSPKCCGVVRRCQNSRDAPGWAGSATRLPFEGTVVTATLAEATTPIFRGLATFLEKFEHLQIQLTHTYKWVGFYAVLCAVYRKIDIMFDKNN